MNNKDLYFLTENQRIYVYLYDFDELKHLYLNGEDDYDVKEDMEYLKKEILNQLNTDNFDNYKLFYAIDKDSLMFEQHFLSKFNCLPLFEKYSNIGIQLGYKNSIVLYLENGKPNTLRILGRDIIPSVIFLKSPESIDIGINAHRKGVVTPKSCLKYFLKDIGKQNYHYQIYYSDSLNKSVMITPEEATSKFLRYLKDEITKKIGFILGTVITIPNTFNQVQIDSVLNAASNAGFINIKIIKESIATAFHYGFEKEDKKILIIGSFDISVVECKYNKLRTEFNVLKTGEHQNLSEDYFNNIILKEILYSKVATDLGIDLETEITSGLSTEVYYKVIQKLLFLAEKLKKELSELEEKEDAIYNLFTYKEKPYDFNIKITRKDFERLIQNDVNETMKLLKKTLKECNLDKNQIDFIGLTGEASLIPLIQKEVSNYFGKPITIKKNAVTVVAESAVIYANLEKINTVKEFLSIATDTGFIEKITKLSSGGIEKIKE